MEDLKKKGIKTKLLSQTGVNYFVHEILEKGLVERGVDWAKIEVSHIHTCRYKSMDITVDCKNLIFTETALTNYTGFIICAKIPMHLTKNKRLSVGFGCGCDVKPSSDHEPDPDWDMYKGMVLGGIMVYLVEDDPRKQKYQDVPMEDILQDEKSCKILTKILTKIFAEVYLSEKIKETCGCPWNF